MTEEEQARNRAAEKAEARKMLADLRSRADHPLSGAEYAAQCKAVEDAESDEPAAQTWDEKMRAEMLHKSRAFMAGHIDRGLLDGPREARDRAKRFRLVRMGEPALTPDERFEMDRLLYGESFLHVQWENGKLVEERIPPEEVWKREYLCDFSKPPPASSRLWPDEKETDKLLADIMGDDGAPKVVPPALAALLKGEDMVKMTRYALTLGISPLRALQLTACC